MATYLAGCGHKLYWGFERCPNCGGWYMEVAVHLQRVGPTCYEERNRIATARTIHDWDDEWVRRYWRGIQRRSPRYAKAQDYACFC